MLPDLNVFYLSDAWTAIIFLLFLYCAYLHICECISGFEAMMNGYISLHHHHCNNGLHSILTGSRKATDTNPLFCISSRCKVYKCVNRPEWMELSNLHWNVPDHIDSRALLVWVTWRTKKFMLSLWFCVLKWAFTKLQPKSFCTSKYSVSGECCTFFRPVFSKLNKLFSCWWRHLAEPLLPSAFVCFYFLCLNLSPGLEWTRITSCLY